MTSWSRDFFRQCPVATGRLLLSAAGTGLRWGEATGLRWDAIDLVAQAVSVVRVAEEVLALFAAYEG